MAWQCQCHAEQSEANALSGRPAGTEPSCRDMGLPHLIILAVAADPLADLSCLRLAVPAARRTDMGQAAGGNPNKNLLYLSLSRL